MKITKKLKPLKWLLSATLLLLLTSCATVPDIPVFEHLSQRVGTDPISGHMILKPSDACMEAIAEPECGHGVFILSQKEIMVGEAKETWFNGKPWSQLRRESVYLPAVESYAPISEYIINSCKKNNCNEQVDSFRIKLDELRSIGAVISHP